ncbi:neutral zinc metallopeptidase [Nonomuraea sp. NPDC049152]|uniref:neutral zinc metallopeptidase n=1 Tax=Nonomuraea sp. NPDC049152 TaxID=3154350 RepID=UPI0033CD7AF7
MRLPLLSATTFAATLLTAATPAAPALPLLGPPTSSSARSEVVSPSVTARSITSAPASPRSVTARPITSGPATQGAPSPNSVATRVVASRAVPPGAVPLGAPGGSLYRTGRLRAASCPEPPLVSGGIPRPKEYLLAITKCLDKGWSAHFGRARLTYSRPKVLYVEEPMDRVCGVRWPGGAAAFYCTDRATLVFPLEGQWIDGRTDLYPLKVAAHEYGHHVQQQAGIRAAYEKLIRARRGDQAELGRRYELQADCLSGVFAGSVWRSLGGRSAQDWTALVDAVRASGDDPEGPRSHGSGASRVSWLKRGYAAVSPSACDTWSVPSSKIS